MSMMASSEPMKPTLYLEGEQLAGLNLVNPTVGQELALKVEGCIKSVSLNEDKVCICVEIDGVSPDKNPAKESPDLAEKMFPDMKKKS